MKTIIILFINGHIHCLLVSVHAVCYFISKGVLYRTIDSCISFDG